MWSGRSVAWMPEVVGCREVVPLRASGRVRGVGTAVWRRDRVTWLRGPLKVALCDVRGAEWKGTVPGDETLGMGMEYCRCGVVCGCATSNGDYDLREMWWMRRCEGV